MNKIETKYKYRFVNVDEISKKKAQGYIDTTDKEKMDRINGSGKDLVLMKKPIT